MWSVQSVLYTRDALAANSYGLIKSKECSPDKMAGQTGKAFEER